LVGVVYNIPICIWLLKTHPQSNPIVYVQPTPSMGINPSRYVDASGRVYLSYLSEWQQGLASSTDLYHCPNCRINELSFENKTLRSELSDMKSKIAQLSEQFSLLSPNSASDPRSDLQADDHADPRSGPPPPHH
jgi:hypothetical protein